MGYYSEQHLIYGSAASRAATTLPGRAEPQDGDGGRIVFQRRLGDEPQYRNTWTVAWITSGVRGVGQDKDLYVALTKAGRDATAKAKQ
jgi:hypothetical protein